MGDKILKGHTPGKVFWLWRALIALSASSTVEYLMKQHPATLNNYRQVKMKNSPWCTERFAILSGKRERRQDRYDPNGIEQLYKVGYPASSSLTIYIDSIHKLQSWRYPISINKHLPDAYSPQYPCTIHERGNKCTSSKSQESEPKSKARI